MAPIVPDIIEYGRIYELGLINAIQILFDTKIRRSWSNTWSLWTR